jgi:aspartate/methionine/tyrosine aminotransferase
MCASLSCLDQRAEAFLQCFATEGCRMLQMSCEMHDSYAAGSQFLTHTTGRLLAALSPVSTPINTAGYSKLLQVVEQTQKDSWELYQGLYEFNTKSREQMEKMGNAFDALRDKLKAGMQVQGSSSPAAASSSAAAPTVSFNPLVERMNESATVAMADRSKALVAQGIPVVSLGVGEVLSVKTPQIVLDAACAALQAGQTTYTSTNGMLPLREAICVKLKSENGLSYTPSQICVSNGAKQCIFQAIQALLTPEQNEVIIPAPFWVSYPDMVQLAGGAPKIVTTTPEEGYVLSAQKLEAAITSRTKILILCSPSNPTGVVYTREQLMALVSVLERHPQVHVLSDEIYEHLLFDGAKHFSFASLSSSMFARTITVNGMSKGYVMTGFRVGFVAASSEIISRINKVQGQITSCASSISQHAALAALTKLPASFRSDLVATLTQTRSLLLAALRDIPRLHFLQPNGAFYVLVDVHEYFGAKGKGGKEINDRSVRDVRQQVVG